MAEITRQRTGELLRKLLELLQAAPEGLRAKDALAALEKKVELTPYEKGNYASGRRFEKIVRFATLDASKAGWIIKSKGHWTITDAGRKAYQKYPDPETFYKEAVRLYNVWKNSQIEDGGGADDTEVTKVNDRTVTQTFDEAEENAWAEIEKYVEQIPWQDFQKLVAALLKAMGYHIAWIAPPGKDGGVDILATSDPLGAKPPRFKVQVKRQKSTVAVDGLRSFLALLGDEDVGIFVNTGGFTRDAQEEARTQEKRKVSLFDLEAFFDLWVQHYDRLEESARRKLPLRPIYFLAPLGE